MARIDQTYFESGLRVIPNLDNADVLADLNSAIAEYEPKFFIEFFGYEFQKDMLANPTEPKYKIILDGGEWTDSAEYLQNLTEINESIADYVYFKYIKENIVRLQGNGYFFGTNENSETVQPVDIPVSVWNNMIERMYEVKEYMETDPNDYDYSRVLWNNDLNYINAFGL